MRISDGSSDVCASDLYVRGLKARQLFPDLNHRSNQGPTGKFSSYWGPFTRSLGVTSERKSFHSFRHCYRNQADMMPELVRLTLMGRSRKDVYGSRPGLRDLKKWSDQAEYPALKLHLLAVTSESRRVGKVGV